MFLNDLASKTGQNICIIVPVINVRVLKKLNLSLVKYRFGQKINTLISGKRLWLFKAIGIFDCRSEFLKIKVR